MREIYRTKQGRLVLQCIVKEVDGTVVDIIEQSMFSKEIDVAHRRKHFAWRFASAIKDGRSITFQLRGK